MLDAVIQPTWEYRYYSFNSKWAPRQQVASMRDGCGDDYFVLFTQDGAILKGYSHESSAAEHVVKHGRPLPGMFDGVPNVFAAFLQEPAFSIAQTTFCYWRTHADRTWQTGRAQYPISADPNGAAALLAILQGDPIRYANWAEDYYEKSIDPAAVGRIYKQEALTIELVHALNPGITMQQLAADIAAIEY